MTTETETDSYYERKKEDLSKRAKQRWASNEGGYRARGLERARDKRALERAERANAKFTDAIKAKRRVKLLKSTKLPRFGAPFGKAEYLYPSSHLALACGRSPMTVRTWIEARVLPGYAQRIHGRYWFTKAFIDAVVEGLRKALYVDGRAPHPMLRRYVVKELEAAGVEYIPFTKEDAA